MKTKLLYAFLLLATISVSAQTLVLNSPTYKLCDVNIPGNGQEIFDLTSKIPEITGGASNLEVYFFESEYAAHVSGYYITNPTAYLNLTPSQTIVVGVRDKWNSKNNGFASLYLQVVRVPKFDIGDLYVYEEQYDGFANFDLNAQKAEILAKNTNVSISYYKTEQDAQSGLNPLPNTYINISNPQTIFVKAVSNEFECSSIKSFKLFVNKGVEPIINIPDSAFKARLLASSFSNTTAGGIKIDSNDDGEIQLSETLRVTSIDVENSKIESMEGVKSFAALKYLSCGFNPIKTLDVSEMINLTSLDVRWVVV